MQASEIELHTGSIARKHKVLGTIEVRLSAATVFSKEPSLDDANAELRRRAANGGANGVIEVTYRRSASLTSYKVLKAFGTAVLLESDMVACPTCAEEIKRAALKCRFCGSEMLALAGV